jgi:hypothetical protein
MILGSQLEGFSENILLQVPQSPIKDTKLNSGIDDNFINKNRKNNLLSPMKRQTQKTNVNFKFKSIKNPILNQN